MKKSLVCVAPGVKTTNSCSAARFPSSCIQCLSAIQPGVEVYCIVYSLLFCFVFFFLSRKLCLPYPLQVQQWLSFILVFFSAVTDAKTTAPFCPPNLSSAKAVDLLWNKLTLKIQCVVINFYFSKTKNKTRSERIIKLLTELPYWLSSPSTKLKIFQDILLSALRARLSTLVTWEMWAKMWRNLLAGKIFLSAPLTL